ncbi:hypothetical protein ADK67_04580 [Saccharothrix sp. NRRL B-16348]|uniref:hypothetical protein n=1 Tax=Saccharothrix sp. NRRL B-16348 TaxID=1415542 RepID=UPI0006B05510|nr:hypothetical protein [Saccharothrix sp. NRRL B-16348]KOX34214.1 hypothetical protein ADK67_04580 [Saccharothrix sp. NRRL B-16348]
MTSGEGARLRRSDDPKAADWVRRRLRRFGSGVAAVVPDGFAAYARILHPAFDADGRAVSWAEIAASTGRRVHALAQFGAITADAWPDRPPEIGNLPADEFRRLCAVLTRHTDTPDRCWFGLWNGYGWLDAAERGGEVRLPGRDYLLFTGPLSAVGEPGWRLSGSTTTHQSPNLLWLADRAWCVGGEIDLHCTFVGGSEDLVDEILADGGLEAWRVRPEDPITFDSDRVNVP